MHAAVVIEPVGHLLDVGRHVEIVVHRSGSGGGACPGDGAPAAAGEHFGETINTLGAHAALAPPVIDLGDVGRARAALDDAVHAVGKMDEAGDVVGRRMNVGELAAACGLR